MSTPIDQKQRSTIREQFDKTLFVEAGAGTGKTTALVARVVHMVATGHLGSMTQLAAISFTENAAAELRNRIRESLQPDKDGLYAKHAYSEQERERLARGLADLDDAVITTLHGFASRILSEASLEAGLPPGFTVAEGRGTSREAQRAWEDFKDQLLDDAAIRDHLLCGLALGFKIDDLRTLAGALGSSWDRLLSRPLKRQPLPAIDVTGVVNHLLSALKDEDSWPDDALGAHLRGTIKPLVAELESLDHPLDLLEALEGAGQISCGQGRKDDWQRAGLDKSTVGTMLKVAEAAAAEIVDAVGAAVTETLAATVQDWVLSQAERRRDVGSLEYHDLLVLARDVLRNDPEVRRRLHDKWSVLLIDEFQDTDPLQVEIACLLAGNCGDDAGEWQSITVDEGRLFFVGDAKQSIYRFRRADVDIFNAVGKKYEPNKTQLQVNFRSVPGVLKAANAAFSVLIGGDESSGISYADLQEDRAGAGPDSPVLLLGGAQDGSASVLRQRESAHLADVIGRAKGSWTIGHDGAVASYKDMAILLPTRTSLPTLERALQARGVPYRIESRSLVWSTDAVRGLVAILQAIDDPANEVALLAALRNPGLACSDQDLVSWRAAGGYWSLFASLPEGLDPEHPIAAALATLRGWHEQRWWLPVNQLVEAVVRELRLVELTASQRRPRDHWRRLRFLVDQARSWCDQGGSGLGSFVDWTVQQMEDDADVLETVVPEPDDDAVRILTIHGAKGLEFPITLVAGLGTGGARTGRVLWTDAGPEVQFKAGKLQTAGWVDAAGNDKEQSRREAVRLLYVAVTRAMDHLVLGCYHKVAKTPTAAEQLWRLLSVDDLAGLEVGVPAESSQADAGLPPGALELPDRVAFRDQRSALLEEVRQRVATSPTALTVAAAAVEEVAVEEVAVEPDKPADEEAPPDPEPGRPAVVRRRSGRGAAIGTATHRVLELIGDLWYPAEGEISALARLASAEEGIPEMQADIEGRVRSALAAEPLVRALAGDGRPLSEVFLVVRDGERFLEGYIDLLVAASEGLTILDYKTDRAITEVEIEAKRQRYAPQLAAYGRAVEHVVGRPPLISDLIFARPSKHDDQLAP